MSKQITADEMADFITHHAAHGCGMSKRDDRIIDELLRVYEEHKKPLDGEWQSERPTPGLWWVAIAPDKRSDLSFWSGTDPIKDVWVAKSGEVFQGNMSLSDEILTGALWQRRTVPGDPFAKGGGE